MDAARNVTQLLRSAGDGDERAAAELLPLLYDELRRLARARLAHVPPGNTLQPTALVHEAFLRLVGSDGAGWNSRGHFFAAAAQAMRQILVDQARRKAAVRHGGAQKRAALDDGDAAICPPSDDVLAVHEELERLEREDPHKARIVALRYFGGLTMEETAEALGMSLSTLEREWRFIRTLLYTRLSDAARGAADG